MTTLDRFGRNAVDVRATKGQIDHARASFPIVRIAAPEFRLTTKFTFRRSSILTSDEK